MAALGKTCPTLLCAARFMTPRHVLPATCHLHTSSALHDSNRACIGRSGRTTYLRNYPLLLVQPDGSTITVHYKEPRRLLTMPIDVTTLSEEERRARQRLRDQAKRSKTKKEKEIYSDINLDEYKKFWKKK
ncbi:large ribosomal subunit protein mL55 [Gastrophryne carolinensis]